MTDGYKYSRRDLLHRRADALNHVLHLILAVAFGHYADDGFGARWADDETACTGQLRLGLRDDALHIGMIERFPAGEADVLQELRHLVELVHQFACALARTH